MIGEQRQSPPPPESGDLVEPTNPSCAKSFETAFDTEDPDTINDRLQKASDAAILTNPLSDCRNCLEPDGLLRCPLKFREDILSLEEVSVSITKTTVKAITVADITMLQLPEMSAVKERLLRRLRYYGVTLIHVADEILREGFDEIGFAQPEEPITETLDSVIPQEELTLKIEEVPDPRPAEGKEIDILNESKETRPRCARTLSKFLVLRYEAEKAWKKRNNGKHPDEIKPFKHQPTLELYNTALFEAEDAEPEEDCITCLQEYCPIKNKASGGEFYEVSIQKVEISGTKVRTRTRYINRLDGLPPEKMAGPPDPQLVRILMDEQMRGLIGNLEA